MRSPTLGHSSEHPSLPPRPTHPLETVCVSLLEWLLSLSSYWCLSSLLRRHPSEPLFFHDSLSESFYLTSTHNIFSWPISTFLLFSWIGKPVLDTNLNSTHFWILQISQFI